MAVAAGEYHTVVVGEDGRVFAFGSDHSGQLGLGDNERRFIVADVAGLPPLPGPVRQVAAGGNHTGIVTDAGDLLMCGRGEYGQLGLGDEGARTTPTLLARALFDGEAVLMVACGEEHTVVATVGGGVYTFGKGKDGRLGHGDEENQPAPRRVPAAGFNGERVVMVAVGAAHTVALSEAGRVFTWGRGEDGRLGHNDRKNQLAPRQVEPGRFAPPGGPGGQGERVVFVAAGVGHTAAVTAGGRLYTWGYGQFGQLGHCDGYVRLVPTLVGGLESLEGGQVVMVACGAFHTLVVTQDGGLWAFGNGRYGQLGIGDRPESSFKIRLGGSTGAAFGGARVVAAAAGIYHSAAVTEDGALWTWGDSYRAPLGHGDWGRQRLVPTRVTSATLQNTRIGRCHPLPTAHALAFAMGTHGRLGASSPVRTLAGECGLLVMIASAANRWIGGAAGESEALIRLLGGVSAARRRRYVQTAQAGS
jgi:alpha-tubulin suppressor-like RCC1 family protein